MKKNNIQKYCIVFYLILFFHLGYTYCSPIAEKTKDIEPVAWWHFNSCDSGIITDAVSNVKDSIQGNFKMVSGTDGRALKLDGFTTCVTRKSELVPKIGDSFTFEAWIAAATYPWNWCPILSQEKKDYRIGRRSGLNREDLIIWIEHESLSTSRILISR